MAGGKKGVWLAGVLTTVAIAAGPSSSAVAAPADLDPAFGPSGTGIARVDLAGSETGAALAVQPDGRIVAASSLFDTINSNFGVLRLLPQGSPDPSFGTGGSGTLVIDLGGEERVEDIALQSDGRILVAGSSNAGTEDYNFAIARRLSADGALDPSFGSGTGRSLAGFGATDTASAIALRPRGQIVAAGNTNFGGLGLGAAVAQINATGQFDNTFSGDGREIPPRPGTAGEIAGDVALQADGKILVSTDYGDSSDFRVLRLDGQTGALDGTYGTGGRAILDLGGSDVIRSIALQPDGKLVVAGTTSGDGSDRIALARFDAAGMPDASFGSAGIAVIDVGARASAADAVLQPDGKIVVVGETNPSGIGARDIVVARFLPDGRPDPGFGTGGSGIIVQDGEDSAAAVALQPDGKIVVVGTANSATANQDTVVLRLQGGEPVPPMGPPDPTPSPKPKCAGKVATKVGNSRNNKIKGTRKRDVIISFGGRDTINGLAGNDIICAGSGNDVVRGGKGRDKVFGQGGRDKLRGGPGKDTLRGGAGKDDQRQ